MMSSTCAKTPAWLVVAGLLGAGCANHLYFGTHTSIGLDVSGTSSMPDHVSLSSQRFEGAIVPQKSDGSSHSVLAKLDADITWFNGHRISQLIATGKAATNVATHTKVEHAFATSAFPPSRRRSDRAPLVFVTRTTLGVDMSAGVHDLAPSLLVGFKRQEATVIPIPDATREVRSVYADVSIDSVPRGTNAPAPVETAGAKTFPSSIRGARIVQTFATGAAAELLTAQSDAVKDKLRAAVGASAQVRATGRTLAREANAAVDAIQPNDAAGLNRAVDAAEAAGLLTPAEADALELKIRNMKGAEAKTDLKTRLVSGDDKTNVMIEDFLRRMRRTP